VIGNSGKDARRQNDDDFTEHLLNSTVAAFTAAYTDISELWASREDVNQNTAWREDRRIVEMSNLAQRKFAAIASAFEGTRANLLKYVATLDSELTAPVVSKAASRVAAELRRHAKDMSQEDRLACQEAMQDGDTVTSGMPAFNRLADYSCRQTRRGSLRLN
jgi:hypothetical protein